MGLTLNAVSGAPYPFLPLAISGSDTESATSLEVTYNFGTTWELLAFFVAGANWTGIAPILPIGTTYIQVRNQYAPSVVSNMISVTTGEFYATYLILTDGPGQVSIPALTGTTPTPYPQPPFIEYLGIEPPNSGVLSVAGYFDPTSTGGLFIMRPYVDATDALPFTELQLEDPGIQSGYNYTVAYTQYYSFSSVPSNTVTITPRGTLIPFDTTYMPQYVNTEPNNLVVYAATSLINGTIVAQGQISSSNIGTLGPNRYLTSEAAGLSCNLSGPAVVGYDWALTLNTLTGWPASTPVTLTGSNSALSLATGMDYNLDFDAFPQISFTRVTSYTGTTISSYQGSYSAVIPGLATGTHFITVRDHNAPLLQSNSITLNVGGIYLAPILTSTPVPAVLTGIDYENPPATAMNYQVDFNGTWSAVGAFMPASTTGGSWSGTGPTELFGTHPVYVQNANISTIVSNIQYFSVYDIILNQITAQSNIPPNIGGTDLESPPATAMQYQVNGSGGWFTVPEFSGAAAGGDPWSGLGPAEPPGTYTLQVRNSNMITVLSNVVTYTIVADTQTDCCTPLPSQSLGRYRGAVGLNYYGLTLIGDAYSGVIGQANFDTFQEYGNTMRALITAPPIHKDRRRIFVPRLEIDVESGVGQPECCGFDPQWMLDWSQDGGRTWSAQQIFRSMGKIGEYQQRLRWLRLGQARQWIFRLQSTDPVRRVIIGTYADIYEGMGSSAS